MSKHLPVEDQCPLRHHMTYRSSWSTGSNPLRSSTLSARHSAIDVSSVHAPTGSENGPPPTMSVTGGKLPGGENSTVVPTASPTASPSRHPRNRFTGHSVAACRSSALAGARPRSGSTPSGVASSNRRFAVGPLDPPRPVRSCAGEPVAPGAPGRERVRSPATSCHDRARWRASGNAPPGHASDAYSRYPRVNRTLAWRGPSLGVERRERQGVHAVRGTRLTRNQHARPDGLSGRRGRARR